MNIRRVLWGSLIFASVLSLVVSAGVAWQTVVVGSEDGEWVYEYIQPFSLTPLAIALIAAAAGAALISVLRVTNSPRDWGVLASWFIVAIALQGLLRIPALYTLADSFDSDDANSFYWVTNHFTAESVLRNFHYLRASWPPHAQSNMPGKLMLVYALETFWTNPDELSWVVIGISNAGCFLMYWFTRDLFHDSRIALWAAVLYLFVPGKLFFFPLLNTVTPVVVLLCACLLQWWLRTANPWLAALLGVAVYGLAFYEPLALGAGLLFLALMIRALYLGDITWRACLLQTAGGVAALAGTYAVMRWKFGFDLSSTLRELSADASAFNQRARRPYAVWIWGNLIEFAFGVGVCQMVLVGVALGDGLTSGARHVLRSPITVLCTSVLAILIAIDLLGVNRGEVVRLWIYLACFFQIPAAYICARLDSRAAMALVLATTLLQSALGMATIGFVIP